MLLKQDEALNILDFMRPDLFYVMQGKLKISFEPMLSGDVSDRPYVILSLGDFIDPIKIAEFCTGSDMQDEFQFPDKK